MLWLGEPSWPAGGDAGAPKIGRAPTQKQGCHKFDPELICQLYWLHCNFRLAPFVGGCLVDKSREQQYRTREWDCYHDSILDNTTSTYWENMAYRKYWSHLIELPSCKSKMSTNFSFIFIFK